jgi:hypothetical protein
MRQSTRHKRGRRAQTRDRGTIAGSLILTVAAGLLSVGVAVDMSSAYRATNRLRRVLDAAAMVGARHTAIARSPLSSVIVDAAHARFDDPTGQTNIRLDADKSSADTIHIKLSGYTTAPTRIGRLLGRRDLSIRARGEAVRYPVDMAIVVDRSYSLQRNGALATLPAALQDFVQYFDDDVDRIGLVTYSTWASEVLPLRKNFRGPLAEQLAELTPATDAATDQGLRVAKQSLERASYRPDAERVIVLFTDGPPTAYGNHFRMPDRSKPQTFNGVVAAYIDGSSYRGLFSKLDGRKIRYFTDSGVAVTTDNASYAKSIAPKYLPGKYRVDGHNIRSQAAAHAEGRASVIRRSGYTIYVVGYRGPTTDPRLRDDVPDTDFLRRIANQDSIVDPRAPAGRAVLAQNPQDLAPAFAGIADDILRSVSH